MIQHKGTKNAPKSGIKREKWVYIFSFFVQIALFFEFLRRFCWLKRLFFVTLQAEIGVCLAEGLPKTKSPRKKHAKQYRNKPIHI